MNKVARPKRTFSEDARARMRAGALARYDADAGVAHARVRAVMQSIKAEMADNEGIYPHNKGAVSLAEVARRAEIHPFTFHKPRYRQLGEEVKEWLEALKSGTVVGRGRVRKELGTRVKEWKQLYDDLLEAHRVSETDLEHANEQLKEALQENERLRLRLADHNALKIVSIPQRKGD